MSQLARIITPSAPPPLRERVAIKIDLGQHGHRKLVYDADAMTWLKNKTKRNPLRGEFIPQNVTDLVHFIYACTISRQPVEGKLTVQQVADSLDITQFKEAFGIVLRLMTNRNADVSQLAPYVPTHPKVLAAALALANFKAGEIFLDLGCGDGRALALAHKRGAAAVYGYELDENRAKLARALLDQVGAVGAVFQESIIGDTWVSHGAHVVFMYLLGDAMKTLRPYLEKLPVGTRVVSHDFTVDGWEPNNTVTITADDRESEHKVHLYVIGAHEARNIDMSKPLSDEDAKYLAAEMAKALAEMGE